MACRKLPNGRWVIELQTSGQRIYRRLPPWATKADAQALEARIRRELWERNALGRKDEPSLAAAIQLWLNATEANRKDKLNPRRNAVHLRPFVEGKTIRQVGEAAQAAIVEWTAKNAPQPGRNARRARTIIATVAAPEKALQTWVAKCGTRGAMDYMPVCLSPATVNRRLDVLRAAVRWSWKQGLVTDNLSGRVPRLREENARQVYLTAAQVKKLATSAPNRLTASAIMVAAYTGLRASELLAVSKSDMRGDTLTVAKSKSGKPRSVPIVPLLRSYLRALPLGCSYRRLIGWFWEARKKAGMEHVRFHDLRHSCASMLINAGVDLYIVGAILGHSSPQSTSRYAHLSDASVKKAMRKLR